MRDKATVSEPLQVGAWISYQDMANPQRFGVVYAIEAAPNMYVLGAGGLKPGGARYRVVYENGMRSETSDGMLNSLGGHQYHPERGLCDAESIAALLAKTAVLHKTRADDAAAKSEAKRVEAASLPAQYPNLETFAARKARLGKNTSGHALGASNIKRELAQAFPGIKFSVKSESYSGGNSIGVRWYDGPTTDEIEKIINKYQECDFDGMQDLKTYRDSTFPDVFGGAHYVSCHRVEKAEGR